MELLELEVAMVEEEVASREVVVDVLEGTRTSRDLRRHQGSLTQLAVEATMTPPWRLGTARPSEDTREEGEMPES